MSRTHEIVEMSSGIESGYKVNCYERGEHAATRVFSAFQYLSFPKNNLDEVGDMEFDDAKALAYEDAMRFGEAWCQNV